MKAYCQNCASLQPSSFRLERDAATGAPYEDLCCDTCHFVVATVEGRESLPAPKQAEPAHYGPLFDADAHFGKSLSVYDEAPKQAEPVAWVLEWTFDGEEKGRRLYDDETHCKFDAGQDGGVCRPLVYGDAAPTPPEAA